MNQIMKVLKDVEAKIIQQEMTLNCEINFQVRKQNVVIIREKLATFIVE